VWQWCEDRYQKELKDRVLRGASWCDYDRYALLSSHRFYYAAASRNLDSGFRCVLGVSARQAAHVAPP
jgi:hypothetical protein